MKSKDIEKIIEELEMLKNTIEKGKKFDNLTTSKFETARGIVYNPNIYTVNLNFKKDYEE